MKTKKSYKKMDVDFGRGVDAGKGFGKIDQAKYRKLEELVKKHVKK